MQRGCKHLVARLGVVLALSLSLIFGATEVTAAPIIHACTFDAPGDGCIFDLVGTGGGNLKLDTKADTAGNRWRTTIVVVDTKNVESNVGTGSATSFTGLVQRSVANGKRYEVIVVYEFPLSGTLPDPFPPTSVEVRFWGPAVDQNHVIIAGPRPAGAGAPAGPGAPVAQTGQTTSFAVGDDGDIQAGVPFPTPRFTDHGDGTVTDHLTGLIWLKDANCFGMQTWQGALDAVNALSDTGTPETTDDCGLSDGSVAGDWRFSNIKELQSLIDFGRQLPALPAGHPFLNVQSQGDRTWSSTTLVGNSNLAWVIALNFGGVEGSNKDHGVPTYPVWPVRGEATATLTQ
jgi:Protein of unknown function (DUF1566)